MELAGSKTEANLLAAFAGESQARNKYTYFASVAKKEGYEQISQTFLDTADNEREHAKLFLGTAGKLKGKTADNLLEAAGGEKGEWTEMYPEFARVAREEGFTQIAELFVNIAAIEAQHEARYRSLLEEVTSGKVFQREQKVLWICRNCGHIHEGLEAPEVCPTCIHPQGFFQVFTTE